MVAILTAEKLVGVAIRTPTGTHWRPSPARHSDLIRVLCCGCTGPVTGTQGFYTDRKRFVDRATALFIARMAGQLKPGTPRRLELFSEDVW